MKVLFLTFISLILFGNVFAQDEIQINNKSPLLIGEKVEFHSEVLNENRLVNIYLPNGYSKDSLKTYPIIYLLDGSIDEDFIHISGLVQFCSFSWINIIPESIVVGISNVDRKRDFTFPTTNKEHKINFPTSGESEKFITFIEKELQPFIEKNYNVNSIRTIIGQSFGGLVATEILFKKPKLFDNYIIISPSLWWNDKSLLNYNHTSEGTTKSIYIGVGKEGYGMEELAEELYNKLMQTNKGKTNICFQFFEKQDHGDVLHLAVYDAFEKLFEKEK